MKTIEILVSPNGETQLTTQGFQGASCREASRLLEEALGKATREILTSEFHQTSVQQNTRQNTQLGE